MGVECITVRIGLESERTSNAYSKSTVLELAANQWNVVVTFFGVEFAISVHQT